MGYKYRVDWEPAAVSEQRALGVPWGCPAVLWGPSTANLIWIWRKTLILKKLADFSVCMRICGGLDPWAQVRFFFQVRFWRPKQYYSEQRHAVSQFPVSQKNVGFSKIELGVLFSLYWSKSWFWGQKNDVLECFWTECVAADLKQRQNIFKMDHRNKIQSLVSHADDPEDAYGCMFPYGHCTCEYGHMWYKSANFSK